MDWITLTRQEIEDDSLSEVCAHCGRPATRRRNQDFDWYPPWVNFLFFLGYFPGLILFFFLKTDMRVSLPVCQEHFQRPRRQILWLALGWLLVPLVLALLVAGSVFYWNRMDPTDDTELKNLQQKQAQVQKELEEMPPVDPELKIAPGKFENPGDEKIWLEERRKEIASKLKKRKDKENELNKLKSEVSTQEYAYNHIKRVREDAQVFAPAIAAGVGFVLWLISLAFLSGPKKIEVKEITENGISLVGLSDAFVRATKEQRQAASRKPTTLPPSSEADWKSLDIQPP